MAEGLQIWKCRNGHGLGTIQRDAGGGSRLLLYRNAVDSEAVDPMAVDVIAVVESAVDIRCDICEESRTWAPNQAAFERLMERYCGVPVSMGEKVPCDSNA